MKIIAQTSTGYSRRFLVEMSSDEIARLTGFYSDSTNGCPEIKIGVELSINPIYDAIKTVGYETNINNQGLGAKLRN